MDERHKSGFLAATLMPFLANTWAKKKLTKAKREIMEYYQGRMNFFKRLSFYILITFYNSFAL